MRSEARSEPTSAHRQNDIHRTTSTRSESSLPRYLRASVSDAEVGLKVPTPGSPVSAAGTIHYEPQRRRIVWEALQECQSNEEDLEEETTWSQHSSSSSSFSESTLDSNDSFPRLRRYTVPLRPEISLQSAEVKALWDSDRNIVEPNPSSDLLEKLEQFGNPCQIEWISTKAIPFEKVRGIKNPWNGNKDIHVARNVTPVELQAATSLLQVWTSQER